MSGRNPLEGTGSPAHQVSAPPAAERIPLADLSFDRRNPRLFLEQDQDPDESELIRVLWRDFAVDEVALSIANNGYFPHEALFVAQEQDQLIVVEGNRRLAAVRLLADDRLREEVGATNLPPISEEHKKKLRTLPVIRCKRDDVWQYIGFKHVNGPQAWQSYAKAQYIEWVHHQLGVDLEAIARTIGDRHWTVRRLYRGLMVMRQAEDAGVFNLDDRWKSHFSFSHIYTGLDYKKVRTFLGIDNKTSFHPSPIPEDNITDLEYFFLWLYGRKSTNTQPLVRTQNPDLRKLVDTLSDESGLIALKQGLSLDVSHDIRTGDERLFKGYLLEARDLLQRARGKQLTGDSGDRKSLRMARDSLELAERLLEDMTVLRASILNQRTPR